MCYLKDATIHFPSEMDYSKVVKLQSNKNKQTILICVDRRGRLAFCRKGASSTGSPLGGVRAEPGKRSNI